MQAHCSNWCCCQRGCPQKARSLALELERTMFAIVCYLLQVASSSWMQSVYGCCDAHIVLTNYLSVIGIFRSFGGTRHSSARPAFKHERQGCSPEHLIFCAWHLWHLNTNTVRERCQPVIRASYAASRRFGRRVAEALMLDDSGWACIQSCRTRERTSS